MTSLGKVLTCERGESNPHNPFAVIINQSVGCTIFNFMVRWPRKSRKFVILINSLPYGIIFKNRQHNGGTRGLKFQDPP